MVLDDDERRIFENLLLVAADRVRDFITIRSLERENAALKVEIAALRGRITSSDEKPE
jgi:hypothetical protein